MDPSVEVSGAGLVAFVIGLLAVVLVVGLYAFAVLGCCRLYVLLLELLRQGRRSNAELERRVSRF